MNQFKKTLIQVTPLLIMLWVWFSSLAFVPVPWPDDSAFYFVAKDLFRWPPRWVMLSQAPFEPSYSTFNFNTMPLYPILIGLGRFVGIDGTFLIKFWSLTAWALTGSLLVSVLFKRGLPFFFCLLAALVFSLDPELRWGSVLVRPESLIGLFGTALILGISLGFPKRLQPTRYWDPVAGLLALSAYAHFNAIHLLFPVVFAYWRTPKRLVQIACKTALYLSPWLACVLYHWKLFIIQMETQWARLAIPNPWLSSVHNAIGSLFQSLGSPEPWPLIIQLSSVGMWVLIALALTWGLYRKQAAAAWLLGTLWLWHTKPELWFIYYTHVAVWCFVGIACLQVWTGELKLESKYRIAALSLTAGLLSAILLIFGTINVQQSVRLGNSQSWHWSTYSDFVGCIDRKLTEYEARLQPRAPGQRFRVWGPTFPDVTVELSRSHPDWEFTRTNDFPSRAAQAVNHGIEVEAVVVTETLNWEERTIDDKAENHPEIQSVWMNWKRYYLNALYRDPKWKTNRYICQRGRWQAFLFFNN